ncbi:hypothetical protein M404DRAFT_173686 [Pisolithus tinctorius Marx 270]|uniref:Uncharacterized protein n=1 Tax=Pisolithus tinctorius Marx 270 TaxID=870435 RepID=A0A0C3PYV2_PISTI|nr:hypothetical protein M404DRAFT_173686 [Pisolithus tinctorius Marx 270]
MWSGPTGSSTPSHYPTSDRGCVQRSNRERATSTESFPTRFAKVTFEGMQHTFNVPCILLFTCSVDVMGLHQNCTAWPSTRKRTGPQHLRDYSRNGHCPGNIGTLGGDCRRCAYVEGKELMIPAVK